MIASPDPAAWLAEGAEHADPALIERVLAETGAARTLPEPSVQGWLSELVARALERFAAGVAQVFGAFHVPPSAIKTLAVVLVAAGALALGVALARRLRRRARPPAPGTADQVPPGAAAAGPDAAAWRAEVERRLDAGDARSALEALWWWAAWLGLGEAPDPAWTSRALGRRCRRVDVAPLLGAIDRLAFRPAPPGGADVRALLDRLAPLAAVAP